MIPSQVAAPTFRWRSNAATPKTSRMKSHRSVFPLSIARDTGSDMKRTTTTARRSARRKFLPNDTSDHQTKKPANTARNTNSAAYGVIQESGETIEYPTGG